MINMSSLTINSFVVVDFRFRRSIVIDRYVFARPPVCCHVFVVGDCVPQWPG